MIMGILLGLAAALLYGSSDFGGGLLSRRLGLVRVTVIGSAAAVALAWAVLIISAGPGPSVRAVAWGQICPRVVLPLLLIKEFIETF
jgi:hypothetical protein